MEHCPEMVDQGQCFDHVETSQMICMCINWLFYLMRAPLSNGSMNLYNVTTNKYTCCKSYQNAIKIETYIGKYVTFVPSFWCHSYFFNFNSLISLSLVVSCLFVFCLFLIHLYFFKVLKLVLAINLR